MAKKELDKLSQDMIQCKKDGYGVWYGRWKATQPIAKPNSVEVLPDGWKLCAHCGKPFKPKVKQQKYCEAICGYDAQKEKAETDGRFIQGNTEQGRKQKRCNNLHGGMRDGETSVSRLHLFQGLRGEHPH